MVKKVRKFKSDSVEEIVGYMEDVLFPILEDKFGEVNTRLGNLEGDIDDIKRATGKAEAQCRQYLSFFKDNGVIRLINKNGRKYVYGFNPEHNHKEILNEIEEKLQ